MKRCGDGCIAAGEIEDHPAVGGAFVALASCKSVAEGELESTVVDVVAPRTAEDRTLSPQYPGSQRDLIPPKILFGEGTEPERCSGAATRAKVSIVIRLHASFIPNRSFLES